MESNTGELAAQEVAVAQDGDRGGLYKRQEDGRWCVDTRYNMESSQYRLFGPRADVYNPLPDTMVLSDAAVTQLVATGVISEPDGQFATLKETKNG